MPRTRRSLDDLSARRPPVPFTGLSRPCGDCRFVAEANHRIANHLAMLAAFVRLKELELTRAASAPSSEAIQMLLEAIRTQTDAVARLHRLLSADGQRASVDLADHLHTACSPLAALLADRIELVEALSPGCRVAPGQILPLTQIVSEAITNAVKHAYPSGRKGKVRVSSRLDETGAVVIEVADDGPGLPAEFDGSSSGGLGMRLIRALARQLDAHLEFKRGDPGLLVRFTLPVTAPMPAVEAEQLR